MFVKQDFSALKYEFLEANMHNVSSNRYLTVHVLYPYMKWISLFQIESATFGSITIRYIDEMDTMDEDGVVALSESAAEPAQTIPDTSQEEESFPGF